MTEYEVIRKLDFLLMIFSKDVERDLDSIYTFLEATGRDLKDKSTREQIRGMFGYKGWRTTFDCWGLSS